MWTTEWRAISARITGLITAGTLYLHSPHVDLFAGDHTLIVNARATVETIQQFSVQYAAELAVAPMRCLTAFRATYDLQFANASIVGAGGALPLLTFLGSFQAEFEYLIADTEALARSLVLRAFLHLQRSIVADEVVRERWKTAFEKQETNCESLGACHLLQHGIWAFKTSAEGERTDLVLGVPLDSILDDVRRSSQGLVLTEWKIVRKSSELQKQTDAGLRQARRYTDGILAGFEVASRRYIVIVSEDHLPMPGPKSEGEITYEYRNIAVSPSTPSQSKI